MTALSTFFALLPFAIFAIGLRQFLIRRDHRIGDAPESDDHGSGRWVAILLNAFVATSGWFFVLAPYRGAAAVALGELRHVWGGREYWLTYPWPNGPMPPLMAGFIGWYIHVSSVAWARFLRGDVASQRIYGQFLLRAIAVLGIAIVLAGAPIVVSIPVTFIVGLFPSALPSFLVGFFESLGIKAKAGPAEGNLLSLPGISRVDVQRLEEEGIETVAQLADANINELRRALPMYAWSIVTWATLAKTKIMAVWAPPAPDATRPALKMTAGELRTVIQKLSQLCARSAHGLYPSERTALKAVAEAMKHIEDAEAHKGQSGEFEQALVLANAQLDQHQKALNEHDAAKTKHEALSRKTALTPVESAEKAELDARLARANREALADEVARARKRVNELELKLSACREVALRLTEERQKK